MVSKLFSEQIESTDCDAKFADVWRIENVWGAKLFGTVLQLLVEEVVSMEWIEFTRQKCAKRLDEILHRL